MVGHPSMGLCFQSSLELVVEMLNHAIGLGVVGGCVSSLGSEKFHQSIPQLGLELSTTISDNSGRDTKARDPTTEEGLSHSFCHDASERDGFQPPSEVDDTGQ